MTDAVLAGVAAHNAGEYAVASAIWAGEAPVDPERHDAEVDEFDAANRLLDGLAAFATAVTGSRRGDWSAALDAATAAELAFDAVADDEGIDLAPIERWLAAFDADPELAERSSPPTVAVDGDRPTPGELPIAAAAVVAGAVAAARGDGPDVVADALRFAREAEHPETTRYATFLRDYAAADPSQRAIVFERLSGVVAQERRKEDDVAGLFE
ncbi:MULTISPECIES: hypothetical protein [Halolamina]|uniref:DUF309 domain-containing protein n=1 Tax=Halolamina pelagica TaxID=699431 RepID=A0A1I5RQ87_9EURY|nr:MULTISPECIES: hypothetical protein [Halolamina]NHX35287.1 hypothetical protein [Halolamina sp. R1-12]SFP60570.1 hypothetical protein SAMN05216277_10583 [Halolamina pelagica]